MSIYTDLGYKNRAAYLVDLADNHGVDYDTVLSIAEFFGENEDFDGLVTAVEDYSQGVYG